MYVCPQLVDSNYILVEKNFLETSRVDSIINPIKRLNDSIYKQPNVMVLVMESFGREYIGAFNKNRSIKDYTSHYIWLIVTNEENLAFTDRRSQLIHKLLTLSHE